jgi:hypothetical protein
VPQADVRGYEKPMRFELGYGTDVLLGDHNRTYTNRGFLNHPHGLEAPMPHPISAAPGPYLATVLAFVAAAAPVTRNRARLCRLSHAVALRLLTYAPPAGTRQVPSACPKGQTSTDGDRRAGPHLHCGRSFNPQGVDYGACSKQAPSSSGVPHCKYPLPSVQAVSPQ